MNFRKDASKEFNDLVLKLVKQQKSEFCANDIAKMVEGKFPDYVYQHVRVYVSRIFKQIETEGKIKLVREEQGKGYILKKMYKNVR